MMGSSLGHYRILVRGFDVSPDAKRFLMAARERRLDSSPAIIVVENWFSELQDEP